MNEIEIATEAALKAVRIYAESHPRPLQVSQVQAGEMLGKSRDTIRRMIEAGQLSLNAFGLIPIGQIDHALNAHGLHTRRQRPRK